MTDSMVGHYGCLPGLHGVRDRVPVRGPVRPADRGRPGPRSSAGIRRPLVDRPVARGPFSPCSHTPGGYSCFAVRSRRTPPQRSAASGVTGPGFWAGSLRRWPQWKVWPPAAASGAPRLPRTGGGPRHPASRGRPADELRPARVLPAKSMPPRSGCWPARAVMSLIPPDPGLLWCVERAQRARAGGGRLRPRTDRRLRAGRRGLRGGQRGRLRVLDEGVRRVAGRRSGLCGAGRTVRGRRTRHLGAALSKSARSPKRHPLPHHRRLSRRLPSGSRPGHPGPAAIPSALGLPGLELREIADAAICCGSAGIYNVLYPGPAAELGDRKARAVSRSCGRGPARHGQSGLPDAGREQHCPDRGRPPRRARAHDRGTGRLHPRLERRTDAKRALAPLAAETIEG